MKPIALLLLAACHPPLPVVAPHVAAAKPAPAVLSVVAPVVARGAGWLGNVPDGWSAAVNDDGTIRLEGASGTLIAARGAGDCDQLAYPAPVGELDYGDLDASASRPWNVKIGFVVASGSDVFCRDLGDGQVMVIVVPSGEDAADVLASVTVA